MSALEYDLVIVGAGIAGMTAAIYARRAGKSVLVLEGKVPGGQIISTFRIENWPGDFGVSGADLSKKIHHQMDELGAVVKYAVVSETKKQANDFLVETDDGEFLARAVILAMGTKDRELEIPGGHELAGKGISYCATCDGALFKDKDVAVVGGGNTALASALYLSDVVKKVYLVSLSHEFKGDAMLVDKLKAKGNVDFLLGYASEAVLGSEKVTGLKLKPSGMEVDVTEGRELNVEGIFVAIGRQPTTELVSGLVELDKSGYIVAGEDCHTSLDGVFVAGDCRTKQLRQLVTAAADGAMAASEAIQFLR